MGPNRYHVSGILGCARYLQLRMRRIRAVAALTFGIADYVLGLQTTSRGELSFSPRRLKTSNTDSCTISPSLLTLGLGVVAIGFRNYVGSLLTHYIYFQLINKNPEYSEGRDDKTVGFKSCGDDIAELAKYMQLSSYL